jgi:hypothetical protein
MMIDGLKSKTVLLTRFGGISKKDLEGYLYTFPRNR